MNQQENGEGIVLNQVYCIKPGINPGLSFQFYVT